MAEQDGLRYQGKLRVGSIVTIKFPDELLGNKIGEKGICYEVYRRSPVSEGYSFIFPNGEYDGFSPEDVDRCLTLTGKVDARVMDYQFQHVGQLRADYLAGKFLFTEPMPPGSAEHRFFQSLPSRR